LFPPYFSPAELTLVRSVFDDPDFIYELKHDGFRAVAHIEGGACRLVSRRGNVYKSFASLRESLAGLDRTAVLDGEIVVLDRAGRPQFYDLLRRRGQPVFYAFDCLWLDGRDLRARPLFERKRILAKLVKGRPGVLYAQHFAGDQGADLFRLVCEQDLEGVVAKRKDAAYGDGWYKIRNPEYSQYEGRRELFEKRRSTPGLTAASSS
jgi:bifunctional non-homologous end joining protein LigD